MSIKRKSMRINRILSFMLVICLLITSFGNIPLKSISSAHASESSTISNDAQGETDISVADKEIIVDTLSAEEITTLRAEMNAELATSKIFDYVDESQFVAANHVSRLYDEEELNTYVFLNEDGSHTMYLLDENVKYVAEDGSIKEKDVALVQKGAISSGDVSVMSAGLISSNAGTILGDYTVKSNNIGLTLPNDISKGIELTHGAKKVTLTPLGISNLSTKLKATTNASHNTVAYNSAYGSGVSLKYTPTLSGIKEDIVLSSYTGINSFSFTLATNGMYVYTDVNGDYYIAETEDSVQRFSLGRIVVYDANKRQSLGSMTVETVKDGQLYLLTVSADESFLLDSKTVYPVTIDPSITVSETTAGTAIQDAPVFANYPTSNFGAYLYNNIGQEDTTYGNAMTAVKLSGLADNLMYKTLNASDITSVLFYAKEAPYFAAKYVKLYRLSAVPSWTESTVTWNNVGTYSTSGAVSGSLSTCAWTSFDITSFVKGWKNGNYANSMSILFALDTTQSTGYTQFNSSEYSTTADRPYVVVNYTLKNLIDNGAYYIENKQLGTYVQPKDGATASGTAMELWSFSGTEKQEWTLTSLGNGYYKIISNISGLALSVASSDVSKENGAVVQEAYTGATRQQWRVYRTIYGGMAIKPASAGTGVNVLSVSDGNNGNGAVVSQRGYAYNDSYKDEWYLSPVIAPGATYYIKNKQLGSYMQPTSGGTASGTTTELWGSKSESTIQKWSFLLVSGGYYRIVSALSGLSLSVSSSGVSTDNGRILQESYSGADRQLWKVYRTISNGFMLKPKSAGTSNFVLSVMEGNLGNGAIVAQRPEVFNTSYKEEWILLDTPIIPEGEYFIENKQLSGYYVQPKDGSLYGGIAMELESFNGNLYQIWELVYLDNGVYNIVSKASGLYMGVFLDDVSAENGEIIQNTNPDTSNIRRQWGIYMSENGNYVIKPVSAGTTAFVLSVTDGNNGSGATVSQRSYADNDSYKDEWRIKEAVYSFSVGGEFFDGEDVIFSSLVWTQCGYSSEYNIDPVIHSNPDINNFDVSKLNSEVVYFSTHGNQHFIELEDDSIIGDGFGIYSWDKQINIDDFSLPNAKLYIYDACLTASFIDDSQYNLCTRTIDAGAECVVGWDKEIGITSAAQWQINFKKALLAGYSVNAARNYANEFFYDDSAVKENRVFGNGNIIINNLEIIPLEESTYILDRPIDYQVHSESILKNILYNSFESFCDSSAEIRILYTNNAKTSYVIDYVYTQNGFYTNSGYSITVEDGKIISMRDNSLHLEKQRIRSTLFNYNIDVSVYDEAKQKAISELYNINEKYIVKEINIEKFYDIELDKYYLFSKVIYMTPNAGIGVHTSYYEIV